MPHAVLIEEEKHEERGYIRKVHFHLYDGIADVLLGESYLVLNRSKEVHNFNHQ